MTKNESVIRVRDRRTPQQFTVHNRVIDEWFPIIGTQGLALYCLYCRMASKEDERCWPGYRMIAKHMRMGQSTISDYNKLLVWCGLIHIEEGNPVLNEPNDYYILDIPQVTAEVLANIQMKVNGDVARMEREREEKAQLLEAGGLPEQATKIRSQGPNKFLNTVLKRLEDWAPIQAHWDNERPKPEIVRPG